MNHQQPGLLQMNPHSLFCVLALVSSVVVNTQELIKQRADVEGEGPAGNYAHPYERNVAVALKLKVEGQQNAKIFTFMDIKDGSEPQKTVLPRKSGFKLCSLFVVPLLLVGPSTRSSCCPSALRPGRRLKLHSTF